MKNILQNKLKNYTALTASLAAVGNSSFGAVQINTINYVGGHYDDYYIDIDGDGEDDFWFYNTYNSVYLQITIWSQNSNIWVGGQNPYALNNGYVVSSLLNFSGTGLGFLVYETYAGFNSGNFINQISDKYVGVKFDISGNTHYGWIRLRGITENLDQWMIVDAGWEDTPDTPITIDAPLNNLSIKENNSFEFSVTNNDNVLEINSEFGNSELTIYDVSGKLVLNKTILSNHEQIPYNFPKGLYIIRLTSKGRIATKKIYLD
jgi:hypothetical protein